MSLLGSLNIEGGENHDARNAARAAVARQKSIQSQIDSLRASYGMVDPDAQQRRSQVAAELDPKYDREQSFDKVMNVLRLKYGNNLGIYGFLKPGHNALTRSTIGQKAWQIYAQSLQPQLADLDKTIASEKANGAVMSGRYDNFAKEYEEGNGAQLDDMNDRARRSDLFLGANNGNVGGAAGRVRARTTLAQYLNGKQNIAAGAAKAVDDMRTADNSERLNLEDQIRSGATTGAAATSTALGDQAMRISQSQGQIGGQALGDFFGQAGRDYQLQQQAAGQSSLLSAARGSSAARPQTSGNYSFV